MLGYPPEKHFVFLPCEKIFKMNSNEFQSHCGSSKLPVDVAMVFAGT